MSDAQTQKIQIQNTQIQHMTKCQKDQTSGIFLKRGLFKNIKNDADALMIIHDNSLIMMH